MAKTMRYLYTLLFYCGLPAIFLRLWWKGRKVPGYRQRWAERLGFVPQLENCLWIHAVSLGEMIAARPLVQALRARCPDKNIVITNMTVTGANLAKQFVTEKTYQFFIPYDLPDAIQRFLDRIRPEQAIFMETELWPNILHYTAARGIPVLLANARLSQRSMQQYQRILPLTREMMSNIHYIAAQNKEYADRFMQLGAKPEQIQIMGNLKFDVPTPAALVEQGQQLRQSWGVVRPIVIAASTHSGEEESVLRAFARLKQVHMDALLIIVPRHPERFDEVAELCQKQGYHVVRRSQNLPCGAEINVFVGDSLGELFMYYAMADIAFVGGSFVGVGGHNLLEPAALALPILTGPIVFNFTEIFNLLNVVGGVLPVADEQALVQAWIELLADSSRCQRMGQAAMKVVEENRGSLQKHVEYTLSQMTTRLPAN